MSLSGKKANILSKSIPNLIIRIFIAVIFFVVVIPGVVFCILSKPVLSISLISGPFILWFCVCRYSENKPDTNFLSFICDELPRFYLLYIFIVILAISSWILMGLNAKYYSFNDNIYCRYSYDYYLYDKEASDYTPVEKDSLPTEFSKHSTKYRITLSDASVLITEFEASDYYNGIIEATETNSQ